MKKHCCDFRGSWPIGCGQSKIDFAQINQNYEYFQIIFEQFVDEFNQKRSPKGVIFAKKSQNFPSGYPCLWYSTLPKTQYLVKTFGNIAHLSPLSEFQRPPLPLSQMRLIEVHCLSIRATISCAVLAIRFSKYYTSTIIILSSCKHQQFQVKL